MFDTYRVSSGSDRLVPYEKTVHEHKAPTDESIRLLDEMKEKCYDSILESKTISNNGIDVNILVYSADMEDAKYCKWRAVINGKPIGDKIKIESYYFDCPAQFYELVYTELASYLAKTFTNQLERVNNVQLY